MNIKKLTTTFVISALAVSIGTATAFADVPVVTVNPVATVNADYIMLGDISTITPSPLTDKTSAKVASTIVGRSPLPGLSRPLNRGDICLKLRANGIDPATVDLEGAQNITISRGGSQSNAPGTPGQASTPGQAQANPTIIKFGDSVDLLVIDGPVTVHAKAYATQSGALGDTINVRRDGLDHLLSVTVIAAGQVQLEE